MAFSLSKTWLAGANFHEGAMVVNYPWDGDTEGYDGYGYNAAPDDGVYKYLSKVYSYGHKSMRAAKVRGAPLPVGWGLVLCGVVLACALFFSQHSLQNNTPPSNAFHPNQNTPKTKTKPNPNQSKLNPSIVITATHSPLTASPTERTGTSSLADCRCVQMWSRWWFKGDEWWFTGGSQGGGNRARCS